MRKADERRLTAWSAGSADVLRALFASSYSSTISSQGGTQNVILVGSNYLTQGELYRLGILTTTICLLVFLLVGAPWLLLVAG